MLLLWGGVGSGRSEIERPAGGEGEVGGEKGGKKKEKMQGEKVAEEV